ncbi:zinc finger protein Rlf isoform X1 [Rhinichthys klamathensis goyatoka]|uniref:zinc finger protein Rlf isoform X1 n=1 Tax=Rhinichthys klamathensis goyatoka TaxID=3034132 RepID=UPI0024B4B487|nr:zinc finger protein Rlf isoform X1 [Rhinichthys klamathensis goyatoka]
MCAYAPWLPVNMADENAEAELDWSGRHSLLLDEDTFFAMEGLQATLQQLEAELRQQDVSEESSTEYCNNFCQALMHYAGSRNSVEHGLPLLEVYCLSINCFAAARPHLTGDSPNVALVLKRLALSCLELLLSVPQNEIPLEAWLQFHGSVQAAHEAMLQYGSTDLHALLNITGEGGAWNNPVMVSLLTGQPTDPDEVNAYLALEGEGFMEMRIKHLEKVGEVEKALILNKACANCCLLPSQSTFRQTFVTQLCQMLPGEEAILEISRIDAKDVLDIICNMDSEGDESTAFILCTTYFTQQLQQDSLYCSWELTLLWSKLQRRIDVSLESFIERCLQFAAIARTIYHLLFLIRVIQTEAMQLGLAVSVDLCVKALRLPKQDDVDAKTMVCKAVVCLLPDDLEVIRACQLTEFLLSPAQEAFDVLEELYTRPDQKYDEENAIIPNSLRCELLLSLKAHWPFDPEFWDWKTLKRYCVQLLGLEPEEEVEDEEAPEELCNLGAVLNEEVGKEGENECKVNAFSSTEQEQRVEKTEMEKGQKVSKKKDSQDVSKKSEMHQKDKFICQICHKQVVETRICHHARKHMENDMWTCPVCLQKFKSKKEFAPHSKKHIQIPAKGHWKKKKVKKKVDLQHYFKEDSLDELEPGQIPLDPSLAMYYQSTHDPVVLEHILEQAASVPDKQVDDDYITFDYINAYFKLQDRDVYQCPATNCSRNFKLFKYLGVHIKNEHDSEDPNLKHYLEMKDRREKCTFCRKTFMTAHHHRQHRWVHYGDHPYICVITGCGARFDTTNELIAHKHSHGFRLSYGCELKGCSFSYCDLGQLYHHEAQHFRDAAYTCTSAGCNNFFYSRREFLQHLATHDITFTEKDFETQRKMRMKLLLPVVESDLGSGSKAEVENGVQKVGSSSSQLLANSESKVSLTCVAVCFDGRKFTCGLKKCKRTFTTARELQKHLKIAHSGEFNEENPLSKKKVQEQRSETQANELHQSGQDKTLKSLSTEESNHKKDISPAPESVDCDATLSNVELCAAFTEIMLGLSQLSLNSPSTRYAMRNSQSTCTPTLNARSPAKAANNKKEVRSHVVSSDSKRLSSKSELSQTHDHIKDSEKEQPQSDPSTKPYTCEAKSCHYKTVTCCALMQHYIKIHGYSEEKVQQMEVFQSETFEPLKTPDGTEDSVLGNNQPQSEFLVQATTKPYTCEAKSCHYQSVTSRALMHHYIKIHGYSEEAVKEMEVFHPQIFKPFKCHLCSKSYRNKKELMIHYIQMHHINKAIVEQMSCSFKRRLVDKASVLSSKIRNRKKSQSLKMDDIKTKIRDKHLWQQRCQKKDYQLWKRKLDKKNGQVKAEEKRQVPSETDADVNHEAVDVRGSRRLIAKGNLSHILTKYNKPFHCVHKNCNAAFGNQNALVGHLQLVHHYNRSQLCFPCEHKGCDKQFNNLSSLTKHYRKEHNFNRKKITSKVSCKSKNIPKRQMASSEEPITRFKCTYANCNESYHLKSSLLRHTSQFHQNQTSLNPAATSVNSKFKMSYKKHVFYRHCDPSDSLVVRLQSTPKKEESKNGCQTKLIISPSQSLKDSQKLPLKQPLRCCIEDQEIAPSEENFESIEENAEDRVPKTPTIKKKKGFDQIVFRTHEEALQMCQDRCLSVAFPCMLQNCDSVVTRMSSLSRHYIAVHKLTRVELTDNKDKLCYTAEKLEEIIQKKSAVPAIPDLTRIPNGVLKMEYQSEPATPGGQSLPMSLHSIKNESKGHEVTEFSGEPHPDTSLLIAAEGLLYGSPKSSGHPEEPVSEESPSNKDRSDSELTAPPLIRPPPLDLSPPSTLRIAVDESSFEPSDKDSKSINIPSTVSISVPTPTRQPLRRRNELSEPPPPVPLLPIPKDPVAHSLAPRTFDIATYKPMGFESSFLNFIKEKEEIKYEKPWAAVVTNPCLKPDPPRRRDCFRRNCSVKENTQRGAPISRSRKFRSSPLRHLISKGECTSIQNLRLILERALAGCGDQAIKQLQFLKPVVVLERPKSFASILDLLPSETKA